MRLRHTHGSSNLDQKTRSYKYQQQQKICIIVNFAVPANHRIKLKECEKKDKYLNLAREFKKKKKEHKGDDCTNCDWCFGHSN